MPYCNMSSASNGVKIFYQRYGHGSTKVLLIIGLAGTHESWGPQIKGLTGSGVPNGREGGAATIAGGGEGVVGIEVCCFDNRGMGRSSVPKMKSEYTTAIMAKDALGLLDHLGWRKAHVCGHSMGSMIACKLAAIAPERLSSLALLNTSGGGFECFPKIDGQMLSLAMRFLRAKTPEQRALVDLETHYTKEYLDEYVGESTRRKILYGEYVKALSSAGMQSSNGFQGQVNACWTHKMTSRELDVVRSSGIPVSVIHGRDDIIAQLYHARNLANKLYPVARMVELHGGHLVSHERPDEVNSSLIELIKASKSNLDPHEWANLEATESRFSLPLVNIKKKTPSFLLSTFNILGKLQLSMLYFFGVFVMGFKHAKRFIRVAKPVKVGPTVK